MRTVGWLKKELEKFPEDALCYAYEGEIVGLVVEDQTSHKALGEIYCSEGDNEGDETRAWGEPHVH